MTAFLHGLWMTGDLLIYGAFASFFAVCLGGQLPQWILLLPAGCYGVSFCFSRRPILRGCFGAACLLGLLFLPGWVDRAAYLPAAFYAIYLAARGEYHLSASRQAGVFVLFCKVYPVFALALSLLWDGEVMLTVSLPLAIWAVFLQIFLMRVLRQTSAVYQNPGFLLRNVGSLAALGAAGFLLSCPVVLGTAQAAVGAVYFGLAVPILEKPLAGIAWLAEHALMPALTGLLNWIAAQSGERGLDVAAGDSGSPAAGQVILSAEDPLLDGERILEIVGILLLAVGCILLFPSVPKEQRDPDRDGPGENPVDFALDETAVALLFSPSQCPCPAGLFQIFGTAGGTWGSPRPRRNQFGPFGPYPFPGPGCRTAAAPALSQGPVWRMCHAPGCGGSGTTGKGAGNPKVNRESFKNKNGT